MQETENIEILQPAKGYRYSLDPFLLAGFVEPGEHERIVDLGTGNGIIPLLLAKSFPDALFVGIDIQRPPLVFAKNNAPFATFLHADVREARSILRGESFDMAVSNPPYRKLKSGRINHLEEVAIARHEIKLTLAELIDSASHLLKNGGVFYFCHLAGRSGEAEGELKKSGFGIKRTRFVQSRNGEPPFLVMFQAVKGGERSKTLLPPLTVYTDENSYTSEISSLYARLKIEAPAGRNA